MDRASGCDWSIACILGRKRNDDVVVNQTDEIYRSSSHFSDFYRSVPVVRKDI